MDLSIQDWGAIGELLGALAVVITLVFLTLQIRQNTKSIEETKKVSVAQTYQSRAALFIDILLRTAGDEYAAVDHKYRIARRESDAQTAIRSLTVEERYRFFNMLSAMRTYTDNTFHQHELGLLDEEYYEWGFPAMVGGYGQLWKDWNISMGRKSFEAEVEKHLADRPRD